MALAVLIALLILSFELGAAIPAFGQCVLLEDAKLTAIDAAAYDSFGNHVSISGDTAVINAPSEDNAGGIDAGSAYVFVRAGDAWTTQAKLTASDAMAGDFFGSKVSISGDIVVVGAPYDDHAGGNNAGSVYVFVRSGTTWTQRAKLTASDATADDLFGFWVAVSDDTVVVGASHEDNAGGTGAGSAYVFVKPAGGWTDMTETAKLTASDAEVQGEFGWAVSISGDTILVSAIGDDPDGAPVNAGSGYVFVRGHNGNNIWDNGFVDQQAKLMASDAGVGDGLAARGETSFRACSPFSCGESDREVGSPWYCVSRHADAAIVDPQCS